MAGIYFSQMSVIYFTGDLAAISIIRVSVIVRLSARQESSEWMISASYSALLVDDTLHHGRHVGGMQQ